MHGHPLYTIKEEGEDSYVRQKRMAKTLRTFIQSEFPDLDFDFVYEKPPPPPPDTPPLEMTPSPPVERRPVRRRTFTLELQAAASRKLRTRHRRNRIRMEYRKHRPVVRTLSAQYYQVVNTQPAVPRQSFRIGY